jgi:endo-1,4-beta-xylanase
MNKQKQLTGMSKVNRLTAVVQPIHFLTLVFIAIIVSIPMAQPARGANKFLGNITTRGQVRSDFLKYWNQITGENESKWSSVEGTRGRYNWAGTDRIADFARQNNIPWRFHTLIWGSQYPSWMNNLSQQEQRAAITAWMDAAAAKYPNVEMIDVVNEGLPNHAPPTRWKDALGGDGATGWDWVITAFRMARQRWPNAILKYNDYNIIEWENDVSQAERLLRVLVSNNTPIDAIGVQAHDAHRISTAQVRRNIDRLVTASSGLPVFVTEYDIGNTDDAAQRRIMEEQITMFWNHPKVVGITYWGYVVGSTWRNGTGLLHPDGTERPALTWLVNYIRNNPNPPNDFPRLLGGRVGAERAPYTIAPTSPVAQNNQAPVQIFDLKGRSAGFLSINNGAIHHSSTMQAPGSYVIRVNGLSRGGIQNLR